VITAFLQMVMKMNETMFKPIFLKAVEWAMGVHVPVDDQAPRQVFFYRFLDQLLDQLKSIVVPYYVYVLDDVIGKLNTTQEPALWSLLVSGLQKCLLYDNDGFWTSHLAEKIVAPLVRQLEVQGDTESDEAFLVSGTLCG
jgi:phosphodiesterase/alkaline phosphatase D-like protein